MGRLYLQSLPLAHLRLAKKKKKPPLGFFPRNTCCFFGNVNFFQSFENMCLIHMISYSVKKRGIIIFSSLWFTIKENVVSILTFNFVGINFDVFAIKSSEMLDNTTKHLGWVFFGSYRASAVIFYHKKRPELIRHNIFDAGLF